MPTLTPHARYFPLDSYVPLDIRTPTLAILLAIQLRKQLDAKSTRKQIEEKERLICIRTRTLYAHYVDYIIVSGEDDFVRRHVIKALKAARAAIQVDTGSMTAIDKRVEELEKEYTLRVLARLIELVEDDSLDAAKED